MTIVTFEVDFSQISALSQRLARLTGKLDWITARAMTNSAKDAKDAIQEKIYPMIQGGPNPWTKRGLIVKYARPNDLTAMAGFQYGDGNFSDGYFSRKSGGVAAGRYMEINTAGGDRRPKSSEVQLRRAGLIKSNQFLAPVKNQLRRDQYGNIPAVTIKSILSSVRAFTEAGSNQNSSASKYFIVRGDELGIAPPSELGAEPWFIAERTGIAPRAKPKSTKRNVGRPQTVRYRRGFKAVLWITEEQNYEARFPVSAVAFNAYTENFAQHFDDAITFELDYKARSNP